VQGQLQYGEQTIESDGARSERASERRTLRSGVVEHVHGVEVGHRVLVKQHRLQRTLLERQAREADRTHSLVCRRHNVREARRWMHARANARTNERTNIQVLDDGRWLVRIGGAHLPELDAMQTNDRQRRKEFDGRLAQGTRELHASRERERGRERRRHERLGCERPTSVCRCVTATTAESRVQSYYRRVPRR